MRLTFVIVLGVMALSAAAMPVDTLSADRMTGEEIRDARLKGAHRIISVGSGPEAEADSIRRMVEFFYYDQFRHFQDPLAPYFLMMSKDARLAMGIGGAVRMRVWDDFRGSIPVNGFIPYMIPVPKSADHRSRVGGTPGGSALFMRIIARNPVLGDLTAYIQGDFSGGGSAGFVLKKAYVTVNDWTVGYASTTFSDVQAETPVIDGGGQNGRTSRSSILVRWMHDFGKSRRWTMAASVELPDSRVDADGVMTKRLDEGWPDVAAFGQYNLPHNGHVRLSGILRGFHYRDLVNGRNRHATGWGLQLSGAWWIVPRWGVFYEASGGRGYSSYTADMAVGAYDLVVKGDRPGRLYAPATTALNVGTRFNFNSKVYSCIALGEVRYRPDYEVEGDDYRRGRFCAVNIFWEPTARLQAGAEFLAGQRQNFNRESASAHRVNLLFQFSF